MSEIKPCPFCGRSNPMLCVNPEHHELALHCLGCGCRGAYKPSRDEAIDYWNKRVSPTASGNQLGVPLDTYHSDVVKTEKG